MHDQKVINDIDALPVVDFHLQLLYIRRGLLD